MSHFHNPPVPVRDALPDLASQLQGMVQELQRTRENMLCQIDSQIARVTSLLGHFHECQSPRPPALQEMPKLTSVVMTAPSASGIDPELEQATLAELNQALSLAFKEIAGRGGMLQNGE